MPEQRQGETDEIQARKLLLDFYSSELTTHGRLIVGFAVILFSLLEIILQLEKPISGVRFWMAFFGLSLAAFALWFLLMRHFVYGVLANAVIHAPLDNSTEKSFEELKKGVVRFGIAKRILRIIPMSLFCTTGQRITKLQKIFGVTGARMIGVLLCASLALITAYFVTILVGLM